MGDRTMDNNMKLSIIIPLYNGAAYVGNIVRDIIDHNTAEGFLYEIILVDDGSVDQTQIVCSKLVEKHQNIRYYKKKNGGIASARNFGLDKARGEYITFADQDDSVLRGYGEFLDFCDNQGLDMLITSPYNKKSGMDEINKRSFRNEIITSKEQIKMVAGKLIDGKYLSKENVQFISTSVWNVIYKNSFIMDAGLRFKVFIDYEDDWIFNIETLLASTKIAISNDGYYCWNIHQESESHKSKYIDDLLNKRMNWMEWISLVLETMAVDKITKVSFVQNVLIPRNIMICFNNACWKDGASREQKLQESAMACKSWEIENVVLSKVDGMDWKNRMLLCFLKMGWIQFAYEVNTRFLRRRFH